MFDFGDLVICQFAKLKSPQKFPAIYGTGKGEYQGKYQGNTLGRLTGATRNCAEGRGLVTGGGGGGRKYQGLS